MKFQVVNVTPEMAALWLKRNQLNRPLRPRFVHALADAMRRGEWAVNHQPVAINGDKLLDGQYRLRAIIESGLPFVKMTVAEGAESSTFDTIDIGVKRSNADIFREDQSVMTPINFVGRVIFSGTPTPREMRPLHAKLHRMVRKLNECVKRPQRGLTASAVKAGALAAILGGEDEEYVHTLYRNMSEFKVEKLPRVAQLFMRQITVEGQTSKVAGAQHWQLLARAWIAFRKENADYERLSVKDIGSRVAEIRSIFKKALGYEEKQ